MLTLFVVRIRLSVFLIDGGAGVAMTGAGVGMVVLGIQLVNSSRSLKMDISY